jgi:hypothetical protein
MDEQNQSGQDQFNQFIDGLIGGRAASMTPEELAELKKDIGIEVDDALNRAVLAKLPDDALQEIETYLDNNDDQSGLAELILAKANEAGLDLNTITVDTLLQFKALYTGEVLADDLDELGVDDTDEAETDDTDTNLEPVAEGGA